MPIWWLMMALASVGASQRWAVVALHSLFFRLLRNRKRSYLLLWLVLLPGVVVHEASHWGAAKLLKVPCGRMQLLGLGKGLGSNLRLGYVEVARVDPIRNALVALAPPVVGVWAIYFVTSGLGLVPVSFNVAGLMAELWSILARPWGWKEVAALYVVFAISAAVVPSQADLVLSRWAIIAALVMMAMAGALGWMDALPSGLGGVVNLLILRVAACASVMVLVNLSVALVAGSLDVIAALVLPSRPRA